MSLGRGHVPRREEVGANSATVGVEQLPCHNVPSGCGLKGRRAQPIKALALPPNNMTEVQTWIV